MTELLADFEAFIFDMDGLVLDTEPAYFAAWQGALETLGYDADLDYFRTLSGCPYAQVEQKLLDLYGTEFDLPLFKEKAGYFWHKQVQAHGIKLKRGVLELLDYAESQNIPVGLATNSPAFNALQCLRLAGINQRFPVIVTGDQVKQAKPSPDVFLTAAERLGVDIRRCVVFEDSHTGIVAASSAGAYVVYVPSTFPVDPLTLALSHCVVDNLSQVFESLVKHSANGI